MSDTPPTPTPCPAGSPSPTIIGGPSAWRGADLSGECCWQFTWTDAEVEQLTAAARAARARGRTPGSLMPDDFAVPGCMAKLAAVQRELESGHGLVRIKGLPIAQIDPDLVPILWMGICQHLGTPVHQHTSGELIRYIHDEGTVAARGYGHIDDTSRGDSFLSSRARTASTGALRFHTDRTDVVGLLCTGLPHSGGLSRVASSVAVHDEMVARRPDLAAALYEPIWRSRLGEEQGGESMAYPLPVFGVRGGQFTSHYSRTYVEAAQLNPRVPRMSDQQWEALDLLAELASELSLDGFFELGDMQLLNSHVTYHARDAFENDSANGKVRALLRIWLCTPKVHRALPENHAVLWRAVEPGQLRGGIGLASMA